MPDFKVSTNLVCSIVYNLVERLETLHSLGFIHGDICPDCLHFILGAQNETILILSSFGLSSQFLIDDEHVLQERQNEIDGRLAYASKNRL